MCCVAWRPSEQKYVSFSLDYLLAVTMTVSLTCYMYYKPSEIDRNVKSISLCSKMNIEAGILIQAIAGGKKIKA